MKTNELLDPFLHVYFHHIENILNTTKNKLEEVKFQSEEANTDEFLKKYFRTFILDNNNINGIDNLSELLIQEGENNLKIKLDDLKRLQITNVFLPEDLTDNQRREISKSKNSVYTNPDIYLEISDGKETFCQSVELKSTKDDKIPGSSVQQIAPFEWVIFVKRLKTGKVVVTTGHYINSITEKLPFPDRSPRPQIAFSTLEDWNQKNRKKEQDILTINIDVKSIEEKKKIFDDWQNVLVEDWMDVVMANSVRLNEKWFNNTIRKFSLTLIDSITNMSDDDVQKLATKLKSQIK